MAPFQHPEGWDSQIKLREAVDLNPDPKIVEQFRKELHYTARENELWYTTRGGDFTLPWAELKIWDVAPLPAGWKKPNIGFRCVKDAQ